MGDLIRSVMLSKSIILVENCFLFLTSFIAFTVIKTLTESTTNFLLVPIKKLNYISIIIGSCLANWRKLFVIYSVLFFM